MREIFLGREKIFTLNVIFFHVTLIAISFAFVYIFSYSTSFRYSFFGLDSSVFQTVGKYWLEGSIPYKDLFDHKGPIVYVINAIGYAIYPRSGIMVPQIIFLYLSCLFIWRAMELYSSGKEKIFFMIFAMVYYAAHYQEGNHVTEYSNLFLAVAAYCFLRSLKEDKFPSLYGFVYGFGFGACLLIRLSDAAQICCQCFLVAVFLLQTRDFKTLWQNVLNFCAGFVAIILPFVIYFAAQDALYDLLYGTILFNLKYATIYFEKPPTLILIIYFLIQFMPLYVLIGVSLWKLSSNRTNRLAWSGLFVGVMVLTMLVNFRTFRHYLMIIFPMTPLFFAVLSLPSPAIKKFSQKLGCVLAKAFIIFCYVIFVLPFSLYLSPDDVEAIQTQDDASFFLFASKDNEKLDLEPTEKSCNPDKLMNMIPDDEKNSVAMWGEHYKATQWILEKNIKSRERLFFFNNYLTKADSTLKDEWFKKVNSDYPLWILYGFLIWRDADGNPDINNTCPELEQLLEEKYSLKGETYIYPQMIKLYRLKE